MNENTKLETAVEILASKIASYALLNGYALDDKLKNLIKNRNEMYKGNQGIINKIIKK